MRRPNRTAQYMLGYCYRNSISRVNSNVISSAWVEGHRASRLDKGMDSQNINEVFSFLERRGYVSSNQNSETRSAVGPEGDITEIGEFIARINPTILKFIVPTIFILRSILRLARIIRN